MGLNVDFSSNVKVVYNYSSPPPQSMFLFTVEPKFCGNNFSSMSAYPGVVARWCAGKIDNLFWLPSLWLPVQGVGRSYAVYNQLILDIRVLLNNKSRHYSSSSYLSAKQTCKS